MLNPPRLQRTGNRVQRGIGIIACAADEYVDGSIAVFWPGVDRDVRFGQQGHAGHALAGAEGVEHDLQDRCASRSGTEAQSLFDPRYIVKSCGIVQIRNQVLALIGQGLRHSDQAFKRMPKMAHGCFGGVSAPIVRFFKQRQSA
jgi:hypothetical protein